MSTALQVARRRGRDLPSWLSAFTVFAAVLLLHLVTGTLLDDHFDRIVRGRQILVFGELPFRDFFDPGYPLTSFSSAAVQALFGDRLFGEVLLNSVFIAAGYTLVFLLVARTCGSRILAVALTGGALFLPPRLYNYDKVFFYTWGIFLCWRYADNASYPRLVALAAGTALAALFRYDSGVYISCAVAVMLLTVHWTRPVLMLQRMMAYSVAVVIILAPALLVIQMMAGLDEAASQIWLYAQREGDRTSWFELPPLELDLRDGGVTFIYYVLYAVPISTIVLALARFGRRDPHRFEPGTAHALSAATLSFTANLFLLRDPISARLGDVAGPAAVTMGCLIALVRAWPLNPWIRWVSAVPAAVLYFSLASYGWAHWGPLLRIAPDRLGDLLGTPPPPSLLPTNRRAGLIDYVHRCTRPSDRLFLVLFAPDVYYFSERGFAGGVVELFGDHWSSTREQRMIVARLAAQSVPLVIARRPVYENLSARYGIIAGYLSIYYEPVGNGTFDDPESDGLVVLARKDASPTHIDRRWALPCFH